MRKLAMVFLLLWLAGSALAIERQSNADYHARRAALSRKTDGGVVVLFAATEGTESPIYGFRQDDNFYYLTGLAEPGAALLIAPETAATDSRPARAYTEILFLPAHNYTTEKWTGPKLSAGDPGVDERTGFDRVQTLDKLRDELVKVLPAGRAAVYSDVPELGESSTSIAGLEWLRRANAFTSFAPKDVKPLMGELRRVKDPGEVALIRKAVEASMAGHRAAMEMMKPGINEREVAARMQYEYSRRGCERPAYAGIVGSGPNSTVLHYSADSATIQPGDVVVIDVAGEYSMYASDITRTLPSSGKFTPRQREIYEIVLGAQEAAMKAFRAGVSRMRGGPDSDNLNAIAKNYINTHGKDLHGKPLGEYFIHGLGHYVGLNVHDPSGYDVPLDKGMVFTIEPGIYIPEEKLGVRIEDMYWVDNDGKLVHLTASLPRAADAVEAAIGAGRLAEQERQTENPSGLK